MTDHTNNEIAVTPCNITSVTYGGIVHESDTGEVLHSSNDKLKLEKFTRNVIQYVIDVKHGRVNIEKKKKKIRGFRDPYVYFFKKGMRDLSKNDTIRGQDFRVLLYILSWLDENNIGLISRSAIKDNLEIKESNISASLKRLEDAGILRREWIKDKYQRNVKGVRINANLSWCGEAEKCTAENTINFFSKIPEHRTKRGA